MAIHTFLLAYAQKENIENGRKIRIDSTAVETDIHKPTDSTRLCSGMVSASSPAGCSMARNSNPAQLLVCGPSPGDEEAIIEDTEPPANSLTERHAYKDMLCYAAKVVAYAEMAIPVLAAFVGDNLEDHFRFRGKISERISGVPSRGL